MRQQQSGFSLLELMIVLIVAGIIIAFGVPSFNSQIKNSRLTSSVNDLVAAMHLSRSEASKRNTPVIMCTSSNALTADAESCTNTDWNLGWLVYADVLQNGTFDRGEDAIIQRQGAQAANLIIDEDSDDDITRSITYLPNGFADLTLNGQSDRYLVYCDSNASEDRFSRVLALSNSGRPRILSSDRSVSGAPSCE